MAKSVGRGCVTEVRGSHSSQERHWCCHYASLKDVSAEDAPHTRHFYFLLWCFDALRCVCVRVAFFQLERPFRCGVESQRVFEAFQDSDSSGATRLQWCVSSVDGSAGFRQWTDDHSGHFWIQISSDLTLTYVHMHLNLNLKGLKRLNLFKGAFRSRFLWVQQRQQLKRQLKVAEPPVMFA